jgi:hypothetical protein
MPVPRTLFEEMTPSAPTPKTRPVPEENMPVHSLSLSRFALCHLSDVRRFIGLLDGAQ